VWLATFGLDIARDVQDISEYLSAHGIEPRAMAVSVASDNPATDILAFAEAENAELSSWAPMDIVVCANGCSAE
jgi:hypothetical protein